MRCPNCLEEGDVKWLLRHQKINKEDAATNANVITILCVKCKKNASVFIADYLPEMFPEWDETPELFQQYLAKMNAEDNLSTEDKQLVELNDEN